MRRRVAIAIVVVLLPVAAHAVWDYVESRRLFAAIDDLRRQGEPVSRNALGPWERPTDEEEIRSARYYNAAAELAFRDWVWQRPSDKIPAVEAKRRIYEDLDVVAKSGTLTAEIAGRLSLIRAEYQEALEMNRRAAPLRFSRFPAFGYEDVPRIYSLQNLFLACSAETVLLVFETAGEEAAQSLWSCLRLGRTQVSTGVYGRPVNHLVTELRFVLEKTRPSAALLAQLQGAFADREQPDFIERDIRERRALAIESMLGELYGARTDPLTPSAHVVWTWRPALPARPWIAHEMTASLKRTQEVLAVAARPWPEKITAAKAMAAGSPTPQTDGRSRPLDLRWFARYLPVMVSPEEAATVLSRNRTAQAVLAVERYRRDRGVLPVSLAALVPAYISAVPMDPFSGKDLLFRADKTGFRVYAAGANGADDGGDVEPLTGIAAFKTKDIGLAIRTRQDSK